MLPSTSFLWTSLSGFTETFFFWVFRFTLLVLWMQLLPLKLIRVVFCGSCLQVKAQINALCAACSSRWQRDTVYNLLVDKVELLAAKQLDVFFFLPLEGGIIKTVGAYSTYVYHVDFNVALMCEAKLFASVFCGVFLEVFFLQLYSLYLNKRRLCKRMCILLVYRFLFSPIFFSVCLVFELGNWFFFSAGLDFSAWFHPDFRSNSERHPKLL